MLGKPSVPTSIRYANNFGTTLSGIVFVCLLVFSIPAQAALFNSSWQASKIASLTGPGVRLLDKNKNVIGELNVNHVRELIEVQRRLEREIGINGELYIVDGDSPNAFAATLQGKNIIGFNLGMMRMVGSDRDALAAVMGHELAHLVKGHSQQTQEREVVLGIIGLVAGLALDRKFSQRSGAPTNLGTNLSILGTTLVGRSFSRDQEREADKFGVQWMSAAGYDPNGALRLWQRMRADFSFFSTHPSSDERLQNIRTQLADLPKRDPPVQVAAAAPSVTQAVGPASKQVITEFQEDTSDADDPFILGLTAYRAGRYTEAFTHAMESANRGDARGQFGVGYLYLAGQGVSKDYSKAAEFLTQAADQQSLMATTYLGLMHELGLGFPKDFAAAAGYYQKGVDAEFPNAMARLAALKFSGAGVPKDPQGALELANKAAEQNDSLGAYLVGNAYFTGSGVPQDYTQTRNWMARSAQQGFTPAIAMMGVLYVQGRGVPQNFAEAARYYKLAADKNNVVGKVGLATLHLSGRGVPRDYAESRRLFEEAYKQGNAVAAAGLGQIYRDGLGVAKEAPRALAWFDVAVRKGYAAATKPRDDLTATLTPADVQYAKTLAEFLLTQR